jgi:hypothetical protein
VDCAQPAAAVVLAALLRHQHWLSSFVGGPQSPLSGDFPTAQKKNLNDI